MYIFQFGAYQFPTEQLELTETSGAGRRGATSPLGGAGGSWDDVGYGPDPLAEDTISKTLILEGAGATEALRRESLRTQFDALLAGMMRSTYDYNQGAQLLFATMPNSDTRATWAKCVECRARWEYYNVNSGWLPVSILFRRAWPVWEVWFDEDLDFPIYVLYLGDQMGTLTDTAAAGWDLGASHAALLYNGAVVSSPHNDNPNPNIPLGNARQFNVVIEYLGQITNPRLTNLDNGHYFEYTGTLAAGDRLVVRSPQCTARLNGALVPITIGTARGQILPWVIEAGYDNNFRLTGSGTINGTLRIYSPAAYY